MTRARHAEAHTRDMWRANTPTRATPPQPSSCGGTSAAWINPADSWQPNHYDYSAAGGTPIDPTSVDLFGVTDGDQAQRETVYLDRLRLYNRKTIRWQTELDGHLVNVGDLVALAHDVPAWGQSGELLAIAATTYTSSEPLTWTPAATHYVLLRRPDGSVAGPYVVTEVVGHADQFTCAASLDFTPRLDLSNGDRTRFSFGPGTRFSQDVVVTAVAPGDGVTIEITAIPYDARIHAAGA
jgi:predicted phage tail protein